jgi:hypothetical protein
MVVIQTEKTVGDLNLLYNNKLKHPDITRQSYIEKSCTDVIVNLCFHQIKLKLVFIEVKYLYSQLV